MSQVMQRALHSRFRGPVVFDAKPSEFELTFPDPVHEFNASDGDRGVSKALKAKHWTQAKFDRSMILFNEIIQVFRGSNFGPRAALMLFEEFPRRPMRSLIAIERDLVRQSTSGS